MSRRCFPTPSSRRRLSRENSFRGFLSRTQPRAPLPLIRSQTHRRRRILILLPKNLGWRARSFSVRTRILYFKGPHVGNKIANKFLWTNKACLIRQLLSRTRLSHSRKLARSIRGKNCAIRTFILYKKKFFI